MVRTFAGPASAVALRSRTDGTWVVGAQLSTAVSITQLTQATSRICALPYPAVIVRACRISLRYKGCQRFKVTNQLCTSTGNGRLFR